MGGPRCFEWLTAIVLAGVLLSGCDSADEPPRDPGAIGQYGVGVTQRTFPRTSTATGDPRVLEAIIWYPIDRQTTAGPVRDAVPAGNKPFPIVVFSHGSSGDPAHASYLTEHLATWGFIVVAPPHPGNTKQDGACDVACLGASYVERLPDVLFTLDQMVALADEPTEPLATLIDPERAAVTGFSFGGMTAIRTGPERRFDAIVGIAPAAPASLIDIGKQLDVPVLVMSGGEDNAVPAPEVKELYDQFPGVIPHYLVYFPRAKHTNFQDLCQEACSLMPERGHELIARYVTAFLHAHLLGNDDYLPFLKQGSPPDAELTAGGPG